MGFLEDAWGAAQNVAGSAGAALNGVIGTAGVLGAAGVGATLLNEAGRRLGSQFDDLADPFLGQVQDFLGTRPGETIQPPSVGRNTVNAGGLDPIQGYDVGVWVEDIGRGHEEVLLGQFTSILIMVKNATEAYMPVGNKQPVYFDGEMQIAWTMEKGLLDMLSFQQTFGFRSFDFNNRYYRTPRFKITFAVDPVDWWALDEATRTPDGVLRRTAAGRFVLDICKVDTWTLGARAGRDVVANHWTGVAQQIRVLPYTLDNMAPTALGERRARNSDGYVLFDQDNSQPKVPQRIATFTYRNEAETSTTVVKPAQRSYSKYPAGYSLKTVLDAERAMLNGMRNIPGMGAVVDAAIAKIDEIEKNGNMVGPDGFPGQRSLALPEDPANRSLNQAIEPRSQSRPVFGSPVPETRSSNDGAGVLSISPQVIAYEKLRAEALGNLARAERGEPTPASAANYRQQLDAIDRILFGLRGGEIRSYEKNASFEPRLDAPNADPSTNDGKAPQLNRPNRWPSRQAPAARAPAEAPPADPRSTNDEKPAP